MPSPFPGMDPYLESHWGDVHHALIGYLRDGINERLPNDLVARMEERIYVETPQSIMERYPDVRVVERHGVPGLEMTESEGGVAVAEPVVFEIEAEPTTEGFIEIREVGNPDRVVTVVEVLSPANKKSGEGRRQYRRKQRELQQGGVNMVEIDLLRGGLWTVLLPRDRVPEWLRSPYRLCVWRVARPFHLEFYHAPLRKRLPAFRIPLRETDRDVVLDLQELIERCYRYGRYEGTNYSMDPDPPLTGDDAAWADALLREQGRRK